MQADKQPKGRVLVVDDEEPVGRLLELWLIKEGYAVRRATSFEQACEWMGKEPFNLVTLDIMMPVVDGLQALRWFREYHPEVGVVMATALGELELIIEAMRLGAYSYMVKPFRLELVAHELARAAERQRLVSENRAYQQGLEQQVAEQTRELRLAHARLERQVKELEGRDRLVQCQLAAPTPQEASQTILEVVHQVLGVAAVLYTCEGTGKGLVPIAALDGAGRVSTEGLAEDAWAGAKVNPLAAQVHADRKAHRQPGQGTALPLLYQEEVLAVLWVRGLDGEAQQEERNILWRLGQAAALVWWSVQVQEGLSRGTIRVDELLDLR